MFFCVNICEITSTDYITWRRLVECFAGNNQLRHFVPRWCSYNCFHHVYINSCIHLTKTRDNITRQHHMLTSYDNITWRRVVLYFAGNNQLRHFVPRWCSYMCNCLLLFIVVIVVVIADVFTCWIHYDYINSSAYLTKTRDNIDMITIHDYHQQTSSSVVFCW